MHLIDFANLTAFDLCAMYGFRNGPGAAQFACKQCWTIQDRIVMENWLNIAREQVEDVLGYPLYPRFICNERQRWNRSGLIGPLKTGYVQKIGTKTEEEIDEVATDLTEDVFEFDLTVDFTNACEALIFHTPENGGEEITPLSRSITGTTLTVRIAKCTLVDPNVEIPKECLDYELDDNFVDEIVVKRVYAQVGTGANLIWSPTSASCGSCSPCMEQSQLACPTIRDHRGSEVYVRPATYANDTWTGTSYAAFGNCGRYPSYVDLDYVAYNDEDCDGDCDMIPNKIKLAILHVALANYPKPQVCACSIHKQMFVEDQQLPRNFSDRLWNPFGPKLGHIIAYNMLRFDAIGQGGQLVAI